MPTAGSITVELQNGGRLLRLVGEIDAETVAGYHCPPGADSGEVCAVDLTEVRFLSSSAVSFLIRQTQAARARGELPVVHGVSRSARRVLEMTGASALFTYLP